MINFLGHTITSDSLVFNLQNNSGSNADESFFLGAESMILDGVDDFHLSLASVAHLTFRMRLLAAQLYKYLT